MDIPDTLKGELGHRLLLSPFFLFEEFIGALIPGAIFILLLFANRVPLVTSALHSTTFGYKTKIAAGLLMAYVLGKALCVLVSWVTAGSSWVGALLAKSGDNTWWDKVPTALKYFLGGAVIGPLLFSSKGREADLMLVELAKAAFYRATAFALLLSALIPGDGYLRVVEIGIGVIFVAESIRGARNANNLISAIFGMSLGNVATNNPKAVLVLVKLLPVIQAAIGTGGDISKLNEVLEAANNSAAASAGQPSVEAGSPLVSSSAKTTLPDKAQPNGTTASSGV